MGYTTTCLSMGRMFGPTRRLSGPFKDSSETLMEMAIETMWMRSCTTLTSGWIPMETALVTTRTRAMTTLLLGATVTEMVTAG